MPPSPLTLRYADRNMLPLAAGRFVSFATRREGQWNSDFSWAGQIALLGRDGDFGGAAIGQLTGHYGPVYSLAFSR